MKFLLSLLAVILHSTIFSYGRMDRVPKNLKQAVRFMKSDCPDSLKAIIKQTPDKDLKQLIYPWGGNYKTILKWTSGDNENSRLVKYFKSKGLYYHDDEVIFTAFKRYLLGQKFDEQSILAPFRAIEIKWQEEDLVRETTDSLRGVYIPKNLEDCFKQINSFWSDSLKERMKNLSAEEFGVNLHHGFGTWIRNNWQLWGGSRLSKYFNEKGIYHPDHMSGIILSSYHRYLNGKDLNLDERFKQYKEDWEKSQAKQAEKEKEKFSKYQIGDTALYNYPNGYVSKKQERSYDEGECRAKGIVIEQDEKCLAIKVRLIESCGRRGIIHYDNKDHKIYDPKIPKWESPNKRIIKRMKNNHENWFSYEDWETTDSAF